MIEGILHAGEPQRTSYISGSAHDEQVTQGLVKDQLRRDAAVGATQHRGFRVLRLHQRLANPYHGVRIQVASYEALVTVHKVRPDLIWRLCRLSRLFVMGRKRCGCSGFLRDRERREKDDSRVRNSTSHVAS